jgi:hypothetical protein
VKSLERNPPNTKYHENPFTCLRAATCGKANTVKITDVFLQHSAVKKPKPCNKIGRNVQQRGRPVTRSAKYWLVLVVAMIPGQQLLALR